MSDDASETQPVYEELQTQQGEQSNNVYTAVSENSNEANDETNKGEETKPEAPKDENGADKHESVHENFGTDGDSARKDDNIADAKNIILTEANDSNTTSPQELSATGQPIKQTSVNTSEAEGNISSEESIKNKLTEHFRDPYTRVCREKVWYKKCPEKLVILVIKFFFVTAQLCMFGADRAQFAKYLERNNIAMKHLLLKGWQPEFETMPYPPATGVYAVYTIEEMLEHINFTVTAIHDIPTVALGSFFVDYPDNSDKPIKMCLEYFKSGTYNMTGKTEIDSTILSDCRYIGLDNVNENYGFDPSLQDLIRSVDGKLVRLLHLNMSFSITSVFVHAERQFRELQCFRIFGVVQFDNYGINGQIPITLKTNIEEKQCLGQQLGKAEVQEWVVSIIVCLISVTSIGFSGISFVSSIRLCRETSRFFRRENVTGNKDLTCEGKIEIIKLRDLLIIISDIFSFSGSILKLVLNNRNISSSSQNYDGCGILIGIGCLLAWLSILHYFVYDPDFNLLFSVMRHSAGKVLRFLLCVGMLYLAFTLCGWVVLGPYHIKFTDVSASFQCLMSLLNGDEIYVTYSAVDGEKLIVWWFNAIFVTVFVVIFTLITLNIFIAIFNSAYEVINNKEPKSDLEEYLEKEDLNEFDSKECKEHCSFCCCV